MFLRCVSELVIESREVCQSLFFRTHDLQCTRLCLHATVWSPQRGCGRYGLGGFPFSWVPWFLRVKILIQSHCVLVYVKLLPLLFSSPLSSPQNRDLRVYPCPVN